MNFKNENNSGEKSASWHTESH